MAVGYRLIPLSCPACGAPLSADSDDVVYYCTACKNGHLLERATGELKPVPVSFLAVPGKAISRRLPFWLLPATVELLERTTEGGGGFMRLFASTADSGSDRRDVRFAVPAFAAPLSAAVELAKRYTAQLSQGAPVQGALAHGEPDGELLGEALTGGALRVEDAKKWAEFALVATEIAKPDLLTQLRYRIAFGEARLLGVPFVGAPGALRDAFFGLPAA